MRVLVLGFGNAKGRFNPPSTHCENYISRHMGEHEIITFGYNDGVDIVIRPDDEFEKVIERLPAGWKPDLCLLWMIEWNLLPRGIERSPFPTAACIFDWDYDIPYSRTCIESVDLTIVTGDFDRESVTALGANDAESFYFAGAMKEVFNPKPKKIHDRKIDVLYTTWIDESAQPGRSDWISKLCSLPDKYTVHVDNHLSYKEYLNLLSESKLVLSYNRHGSMAVRTTDAGTQGTVVLDTSSGTRKYFNPGADYIPVTEEDIAVQIERYLGDEKTLQEMSDRFYEKVKDNFEARKRFIELIELAGEKPGGHRKERKINSLRGSGRHIRKGELYFYAHFAGEPGVFFLNQGSRLLELSIREFKKAVAVEPSPRAMTDLAVALTAYGLIFDRKRFIRDKGKEASDLLEEVILASPSYAMAYFNLGILRFRTGDMEEALKVLKNALSLLETEDSCMDHWCLHNRDFDMFNQLVRRHLNSNLIEFAVGDKAASQNMRNILRAPMFYMISLIEENMGRISSSFEAIRSAVALCPDSGLLTKNAARITPLLGFRDEGLAFYRKAVKLCPFDIGLRTEFIRLLYLYHEDREVMSELKDALRIVKTVAAVRESSHDLKVTVENCLRLNGGSAYSHESSNEVLLNSWIEKLFDYLSKEPEDLNIVLRIILIWDELGRTDKIISITEDYIGRYRKEIGENEAILRSFRDIYNFMNERTEEKEIELDSRLREIERILEHENEMIKIRECEERGAM